MLNDIDRFRALADTTGVPLYNVPGDHEMQSDPVAVAILEEKGHDLWGSFDIGAYHLIGLNTDEVNREGRVTGEQLEWLKEDLAASAGVQGIFVFMHRPMFSWFQGDFNPDDVEILRGSSARIRSAPSSPPTITSTTGRTTTGSRTSPWAAREAPCTRILRGAASPTT
jgi:hypothetical protein